MTVRPARVLGWAALALALAVAGHLLLATTFMPYDDEGFMLVSLRAYLGGLRLYDDVFTQYGPWPFVYHRLVTTLAGGAPLTHAFGRALTLAHWVLTALAGAGIVWQLTRRHLAAASAAVLTFALLWQNTSEPSHPGSHLALLVALGGLLLARLPESPRPGWCFAGLGVLAGLLLLTKVNVGLFFVAGVAAWTLRHTAWPAPLRRAAALASLGVLLLPWLLLARQLGQPWALTFAVQFTLAGAALVWLFPSTEPRPALPASAAWPALAATAGTVGLVSGLVLAGGTTLSALVAAVLVKPLAMPARFLIPVTWYPEVWALAAAGAFVSFRAGREIRAGGGPGRTTTLLGLGLRGAVLLLVAFQHRLWPTYPGIFHFVCYALPLLPVFVLPLGPAPDSPRARGAAGVAWLALPQILHAFPVAGSQLGWGSFLFVPLLVLGWQDAATALGDLGSRAAALARRFATWLLVFTAAALLVLLGRTGWERYTTSPPLGLPGAEDIRVDARTGRTFRLLALNAALHADLLFSRQGMYSHNLWSGVPTPTAQNATHWFWLLDEPAQRAIIARLAATPRTAFIVSRSLDDFLRTRGVPVTGPLQEFVTAHYQPLFTQGDFTFHVPRGSAAAAFGRFEARASADPADPRPLLFQANLILDGTPARVELAWDGHPPTPLLAAGATAVAEPIDREGRTRGPAVPLPATTPLRGLFRISIQTGALPPTLPWQDCTLEVREAPGRLLAEAMH